MFDQKKLKFMNNNKERWQNKKVIKKGWTRYNFLNNFNIDFLI
jgi:cell fate regulator YaaT (PSP1 superfamily)